MNLFQPKNKKMKYICRFSLFALTILLLVSCKKDDPLTEVDPTDPDLLSTVLIIPGAERQDGQPPTPSTDSDAPSIFNNQTSASIVSGNTLFLPFNFETASDGSGGYAGCYIQVDGASTYFDIREDNSSTDGLLVLPVAVPDIVNEGEFCLSYCVYDSNDRVSNVLTTCINIGGIEECPAFESGSDGLTIASYDLGDEAGFVDIEYDTYFVPDRVDVFYDEKWVGGSGSSISPTQVPPVSNCNDGADGYVGESDVITFEYDPNKSRTVTIYMSGCLGGGTAWDLAVSCPYPQKSASKRKKMLTNKLNIEPKQNLTTN